MELSLLGDLPLESCVYLLLHPVLAPRLVGFDRWVEYEGAKIAEPIQEFEELGHIVFDIGGALVLNFELLLVKMAHSWAIRS